MDNLLYPFIPNRSLTKFISLFYQELIVSSPDNSACQRVRRGKQHFTDQRGQFSTHTWLPIGAIYLQTVQYIPPLLSVLKNTHLHEHTQKTILRQKQAVSKSRSTKPFVVADYKLQFECTVMRTHDKFPFHIITCH